MSHYPEHGESNDDQARGGHASLSRGAALSLLGFVEPRRDAADARDAGDESSAGEAETERG